MLKTNEDRLVEMFVQCQPGQPKTAGTWAVDHDGKPFILPSIGGITLNLQVGDSAFGIAGDHIEPGVSCICDTFKPNEHPNTSLQIFSCIGNKAKILTGETKGGIGTVIGHHGGSEHLIVDFPREIKEKLTYDDKIMIYTKGQGLKLLSYPEIFIFNLDPELLKKLKIKEVKGKLEVPVTTIVPPECMGSGIGSPHVAKGDYDIVTSDPESVKKYKFEKIRFGDIVALIDHDNRYGRTYRKGSISIGVVVHSNCLKAGHGPGVSTIMTCKTGLIEPVISSKANLADILKIGTY